MADEPSITLKHVSADGVRPARVPDGMRVYAIGDIHGRADLVDRMLHLIESDSNAAEPARETVLVFIGDYVDRGPDSAGVLDRLLSLKHNSRYTCHFLKGNHEVMFMDFLDDPGAFMHWAINGGVETLESYGIDVGEIIEKRPSVGVYNVFRA
jgi:serine/threonine protein phosphatase 1